MNRQRNINKIDKHKMTERKERRSTCLHLLRKLSSYRFAQRGGSPLEEDTLKTEAKGMGCPHPTDKSETHINRQNYLTGKNIFRLRAHTPTRRLPKKQLCVSEDTKVCDVTPTK